MLTLVLLVNWAIVDYLWDKWESYHGKRENRSLCQVIFIFLGPFTFSGEWGGIMGNVILGNYPLIILYQWIITFYFTKDLLSWILPLSTYRKFFRFIFETCSSWKKCVFLCPTIYQKCLGMFICAGNLCNYNYFWCKIYNYFIWRN